MLVEDGPADEELTTLALKEECIGKELAVAHDGAKAVDLSVFVQTIGLTSNGCSTMRLHPGFDLYG